MYTMFYLIEFVENLYIYVDVDVVTHGTENVVRGTENIGNKKFRRNCSN